MIRLSVVSAPRERPMRRGALASFGAHSVLLGLIVVWTLRGWAPVVEAPDTPATVELVMVETKGAGESTAPVVPPAQAKTAQQPTQAAPPGTPETTPPPPQPAKPSPPTAEGPPDLAPPTSPAQPAGTPAAAPDSRLAMSLPAVRPGPEIQFGGADFETNAIASGERVIPARPDAHWHNKEPVYPMVAAERGEHGAVVLLVHISPAGLTAGVDVLQSSGHASLDHAAIDAVWTWRFMPAVKDGQPIWAEMPWRVVFDLR
jgi:protein TonB